MEDIVIISIDENKKYGGNTGSLFEARIKFKNEGVIDCLAKHIDNISSTESINAHSLMVGVKSDELMQVYGHIEYNGKQYIFIEKLSDTCDAYIQLHSNEIKKEDILSIAHKLGNAIGVMHKKGLSHGDIHLGNLMCNKEFTKCKLIDFDRVTRNASFKKDCEQYASTVAHCLVLFAKPQTCWGSYQTDISVITNAEIKNIITACKTKIFEQVKENMTDFNEKWNGVLSTINEAIESLKKQF